MKSKFLPDGRKFLAELLTGSGARINGIYVEYSDTPKLSLDSCTASYFENLLKEPRCGYARIPVHNAYVDDQGNAVFNGILTADDLKGGRVTKDTLIVGATLVSMKDDNVVNDVLLYATLFSQPVKVIKGVYTNVSITIAIGD